MPANKYSIHKINGIPCRYTGFKSPVKFKYSASTTLHFHIRFPAGKISLFSIVFLLAYSAGIFAFQQPEITNGEELLEAMHEKYEGKWYKNLRFTQKTTFYGVEGEVVREQNWYEMMNLPGKLAIKFDNPESNNGILFADGKQYGFANGYLIQEADRIHDLLVLGYDVYHQAPAETAAQLKKNGYNLDEMYTDEWEGRPVFVVGTSAPDTTKAQFWIDAERLVFVRNFTVGREQTIQEIQFNKYRKLNEVWVAPEVLFKANGFKGLLEEYFDIETPDTLDARIFDPLTFTGAAWD